MCTFHLSKRNRTGNVYLLHAGQYARKIAGAVILLVVINLCTGTINAQHVARMTDELKIELALDLIRKGIQEGDTAKVFVVFAPQVLVKGKNVEVKSDLAKKLQAVFEDPSERRLATDGPVRPSFSRVDNPRRYSKFWDFDIVDPRTTIEGDSAFVDCELVLWGAPKDVKSQESGTRVSERFAFYSPPKVQPVTIPEGSLRFPPPPPGKNLAGSKRGWQLVGYENLVEFLENQVKANAAPKAKAGVEK